MWCVKHRKAALKLGPVQQVAAFLLGNTCAMHLLNRSRCIAGLFYARKISGAIRNTSCSDSVIFPLGIL